MNGRAMDRVPRRPVWVVVLAGGEGERLRWLTERWLGRHVPKQYCAFVGTRSMLEHTLDRATRMARPEQVVTVVAREHRRHLGPHAAMTRGALVVEQPCNRDTAAGAFLGLAHVLAADPHASVVILPSDHFIDPDAAFLATVERTVATAERLDHVAVLGVHPESAEPEYGWILPGHRVQSEAEGQAAHAVAAFVEKPGPAQAARLWDAGALWNTMVVAGPAALLWELGRRVLPEVVAPLAHVRRSVAAGRRPDLESAYDGMPVRNLSRHYLQRISDRLVVLELNGATWSDWGSADRIVETLRRAGRQPAFPRHLFPRTARMDGTRTIGSAALRRGLGHPRSA